MTTLSYSVVRVKSSHYFILPETTKNKYQDATLFEKTEIKVDYVQLVNRRRKIKSKTMHMHNCILQNSLSHLSQNAGIFYSPLPESQPCPNGIRGRIGNASELVATVATELTEPDPCCTPSLVTRTTASGKGNSFGVQPTLDFSVICCCSCPCCNYINIHIQRRYERGQSL